MESIQKKFDDINNEADKLYMTDIENLLNNKNEIEKNEQTEINKFKDNVQTISYDFNSDNLNEKKYNDFEDCKNVDDLIKKEINPILEKNSNLRKEYINSISKFIDDYDGYYDGVGTKIIKLFLDIGKNNDDFKKNFNLDEKNYLIDIAKECDNDEDICFNKEEELKKNLTEMKNCINKEELDKFLENSFKIMDELEVEYRDFFKKIDEIFNSHDGLIKNSFKKYECSTLKYHGDYPEDQKFFIEMRRNKESEFLSKKKQAELDEEERIKQEEEEKNAAESGKKPPAKKQDNKGKKNEQPESLVPPREIKMLKSKLGYDYLIDFEIPEYVNHILRNVIYNRDDDIFDLKEKTPEEIEQLNKLKEEHEAELKELEDNKGKKKPADNKNKENPNNENEENQINYLTEFDPYTTDTTKTFTSPLNAQNEKLLSEENNFTHENITNGIENLFEKIFNKIVENQTNEIEKAKIDDNEKREEQLNDLDIRLKSLAPRKGKIEVESYDTRLNEIEKHEEKLAKQKKIIEEKNVKDEEENNKLLEEMENKFNELKSQYEKLSEGINNEENSNNLENKFKKFKTDYYDFLSYLNENEEKLKNYTEKNPNELKKLNENYIKSMQPFEKGGTYSQREIDFTKTELDNLNQSIDNSVKERSDKNTEKVNFYRTEVNKFLDDIVNKYKDTNENIQAIEGIGKKFGQPKRIVNDILINIKMKCNQAYEGIEQTYKNLENTINNFNNINNKEKLEESIKKNELTKEVKKDLLKINNCIWNYGKYIEAFKEKLLNTYQLMRVNLKEDSESTEITEKEDIELDQNLKNEEILSLGVLGKLIIDNNYELKNTFNSDLNSIDEKLRSECAKVYTGNFAKYLNPKCLIVLENF